MGKRGPRSVSEILISDGPNGVIPSGADAPYTLTDNEADVWRQIVNALPADFFAPSHFPMLSQLCRHVVASDFIGALLAATYRMKKIDREEYASLLSMQANESNAINRLMRSLRLTPQSVYRAGARLRPVTMLKHNPWERKRVTDKVKP